MKDSRNKDKGKPLKSIEDQVAASFKTARLMEVGSDLTADKGVLSLSLLVVADADRFGYLVSRITHALGGNVLATSTVPLEENMEACFEEFDFRDS